MTSIALDEYQVREINPLNKRFEKIKSWYHENPDDESIRWDCVWLAGEIWDKVTKQFQAKIADFIVWILINDDNGVVKHEAAFQIGVRNMRDRIEYLVMTINEDTDTLTRHEAIEALGLMRCHEQKHWLEDWAGDKDEAISQTAKFVLKRLERLKGKGSYRDGEPI